MPASKTEEGAAEDSIGVRFISKGSADPPGSCLVYSTSAADSDGFPSRCTCRKQLNPPLPPRPHLPPVSPSSAPAIFSLSPPPTSSFLHLPAASPLALNHAPRSHVLHTGINDVQPGASCTSPVQSAPHAARHGGARRGREPLAPARSKAACSLPPWQQKVETGVPATSWGCSR
eukprot:755788-Hanusia_phi.AAC.1